MNTIREEAVLWFTRMRGVPADHSVRQRFEAWLAASPSHAAEYAAFAKLLNDLESSVRCDAVADIMEQRQRRQQMTRRQVLKGGALALIFSALAGEGMSYTTQHRTTWQLLTQTGIGEVRNQPLPDGSTVTLGAASGIQVAFSRAERNIRLESGEAIFDVAKDPKRPFIVQSGKARVTVLGTRFAVAELGDRIRVSVDHGRVQVETGPFWRRQTLVLQDNQVAEVALAEGTAGPPESVNRPSAASFAFEGGSIPFEQASLDEVAATLSRYRLMPVRAVATEAGSTPRITALVQSDNIEGFLRLLPRIAPVTVTGDSGTITLGHAN